MGMDVWKIKFEPLKSSITEEELEFIEKYADRDDMGHYYFTEEKFAEAKEELDPDKRLRIEFLLTKIKEGIKENGDLTFALS